MSEPLRDAFASFAAKLFEIANAGEVVLRADNDNRFSAQIEVA